ncbi:MAG: replication-relaxation family protein [Acidimicrobiales bacterium]
MESPLTFYLLRAVRAIRFANESPIQNLVNGEALVSKRTYVTTARLTALRAQLRPIEWSLLNDVGRLNVASGQQLRRLHYDDSDTGRRMARHDFTNLVERRVIARLGRSIGGRRAGSEGWTYALDVAGKRLLNPAQRRQWEPWTPDSHHLRHALAVSEVYVQLRELERLGTIELERFDAEPRCWRFFHGPGGAPLVLKPDAFVATATADYLDSWFIELDRGTEPMTIIVAKTKTYCRYWQSGREQSSEGVFPTVLFVVPDGNRKAQLLDALSQLPAEHSRLFQVTTADSAVRSMASGELINNVPKEVTS